MNEQNVSPQEELMQKIEYCIVYYRQLSRKDEFQYKTHNRITAMMDEYVRMASGKEEQELSAGRLLWKLKKYFYSGFNKNNGKLVDHVVGNYALGDKDKVNFVNLLMSNHLYRHISEKSFGTLSAIKQRDAYVTKQTHDVLGKVMNSLNSQAKPGEQYTQKARKLLQYMSYYGHEVQTTNRETVISFAQTMFHVSNQLSAYNREKGNYENAEKVSLVPLAKMLTKTRHLRESTAVMGNLFGEEAERKPKFDVGAMHDVLKAYQQNVLKNKNFDNFDGNLKLSMEQMTRFFMTKYEVRPKEAVYLQNSITDTAPRTIQQRLLNDLGQKMQAAYKEAHPRKSSTRRLKITPLAVGEHYYRVGSGKDVR